MFYYHSPEINMFNVGDAVLVLCDLDSITYMTGEIVENDPEALTLKRVTWHRQTGRHNEFVRGESPSTEREAYDKDQLVRFERTCIRMTVQWSGELDGGTL